MLPILTLISLLSVIFTLITLVWLSVVDLRIGLLPNPLVLAFACLGVLFHFTAPVFYVSSLDMVLGAVMGGGILLLIRTVANYLMKDDNTLGLGDVKLLAAAGLWLGCHMITFALVIGALAGLVHGLLYALVLFARNKKWPSMMQLSIPAGPGFIIGIILAGGFLFIDFPDAVLRALDNFQ